jgi:hypothetical protein
MYKLEFALPKFGMFKRILAKVLAERFVIDRNWSEERAVELGTQVLRGNTERIFRWGEDLRGELPVAGIEKKHFINPSSPLVEDARGTLLTPRDEVRIEPSIDSWEADETGLAAAEGNPRMTMNMPTQAEIDAAAAEILLEEPQPDGRMTMQMPSQAEIDAAAAELEPADLEPSEAEVAKLEAANLEADSLELIDEPAPAGADSGSISLDEPGSPESRDTYSIRQTEPFRFYGNAEEKGDEPEGGKGDWDFLDQGNKGKGNK